MNYWAATFWQAERINCMHATGPFQLVRVERSADKRYSGALYIISNVPPILMIISTSHPAHQPLQKTILYIYLMWFLLTHNLNRYIYLNFWSFDLCLYYDGKSKHLKVSRKLICLSHSYMQTCPPRTMCPVSLALM